MLTNHENNNTDTVTFTGCADKFVISTGTLTVIAIIQSVKLLAAKNTTAINVNGNIAPIPPMSAIPNHKNLFSSCLFSQLENLAANLVLTEADLL